MRSTLVEGMNVSRDPGYGNGEYVNGYEAASETALEELDLFLEWLDRKIAYYDGIGFQAKDEHDRKMGADVASVLREVGKRLLE